MVSRPKPNIATPDAASFLIPATYFATANVAIDFTVTPAEDQNGNQYTFARGILGGQVDELVDLVPLGGGPAHTIALRAGVLLPIMFQEMAAPAGGNPVTILF